MIVDDFFPGSLNLPGWWTCQIADPGAATSVKIPTQGKALRLTCLQLALCTGNDYIVLAKKSSVCSLQVSMSYTRPRVLARGAGRGLCQ